jgi:hypothetical protein
MSLDIRGYFMHIDRHILLNIVKGILRRMATHRYEGNQTWGDLIDIDFYLWLSEQIVMIDPKTSCKVVGKPEDWNGLDKNKSLFHTPEGCGLPIGNLTSQLLSNVYLNEFDQYAKRILKCQHYGRYVDDSYIVSCDKQWLLSLVPQIDAFLQERLHLSLHRGKTQIHEIHQGVEFLGGFIKPHRTYMSHAALRRLRKSISRLPMRNRQKVYRSVNAMLDVTSHFDSYKLRSELFYNERFLKIGYFDRDITMFFLK